LKEVEKAYTLKEVEKAYQRGKKGPSKMSKGKAIEI
jgi:hypothetical protein